MAINFYNVSPPNGFFNIVGKLFKTEGAINTSRGTTIPNDLTGILTEFNLQTLTPALEAVLQPIVSLAPGYQSGAAGTMSALASFVSAYLIQIVNTDVPQPDSSLKTALIQFISQMNAQGKTVNASAITAPAVAGGGNVGNGVCITSTKQGTGLVQENTIAETILGTAANAGTAAGFAFLGQQAPSGLLGQDWPTGSACNKTITSIDANQTNGSLLTNGGFETFVNQANVPDNWICSVGTPGTNLIATTIAVQTVVMTGTPTAGTFILLWTGPNGINYATAPLPFNANGAAVQTALRTIPGLGAITNVQTGTTPNFTNTITFNGMGGALNAITSIDNTTGGTHTITVTTTQAGTAQVFAGGQALEFAGDGATLTAINQQLNLASLAPNTAYSVSLWAICSAAIAAGVIKVELINGIGGSIINDAQANPNALTFNATALTTGWQHLKALQAAECVFRLPAVLPTSVFLRIRLSTALTNTKNMFVDQVALTPMQEFYSGGPNVAIFAGGTAWAAGDTFTVTPTNNRAGVVREWMNRNLNMAQYDLLLPTSGSPNIPDFVTT